MPEINLPTKAKQDEILTAVENSRYMKNQVTFPTKGTYTWTAPKGIETVYVSGIGGAGGGGGGGQGGARINVYPFPGASGAGGGSGGLGEFIIDMPISVTPNTVYTITIGAGGNAGIGGKGSQISSIPYGNNGTYGGAGGNTSFHNKLTLKGGYGGGPGEGGQSSPRDTQIEARGLSGGVGGGVITQYNGSIFKVFNISGNAGTKGVDGGDNGQTSPALSARVPGGVSVSEGLFGTASGSGGAGSEGSNVYPNTTVAGNGTAGSDGKLILRW